MILLLGDIHGNAGILRKASDTAKEAGATAIIQLGDYCRGGLQNFKHK